MREELPPLTVRLLSTADIRCIAGWRYSGPWRIYDLRSVDDLLDADGYRAVAGVPDGSLVGFCCVGAEARVPGLAAEDGVLDIGVGMNPALVGRGHGAVFGQAVLGYVRREYDAPRLRAVVQSWNERSLRLTRGLGFVETGRHFCVQNGRTVEYVVLTNKLATEAQR